MFIRLLQLIPMGLGICDKCVLFMRSCSVNTISVYYCTSCIIFTYSESFELDVLLDDPLEDVS